MSGRRRKSGGGKGRDEKAGTEAGKETEQGSHPQYGHSHGEGFGGGHGRHKPGQRGRKEHIRRKGNGGSRLFGEKIRDKKKMAEELGIGEITLTDIVKELEKPARDPREDMPAPVLRSDVLEMKDLKPGMILKGTVRNVIDFGAFVDIGVHQDGLVHISQITNRFIKHPLEAVSVGDVVDVQVLSVDVAKKGLL